MTREFTADATLSHTAPVDCTACAQRRPSPSYIIPVEDIVCVNQIMKPSPRPSAPLDTVPVMLKGQGTVPSACADDDKSTKSAPETVVQIGESDPYLVSWDDSDRHDNPRNWSKRYRMFLVVVVSLYTLLSPISSTMNAPAIATLMREFNVSSATVGNMMMSISMIAFVVAPMVYGPISEKFGRKYLLQVTNIMYVHSISFQLPCI